MHWIPDWRPCFLSARRLSSGRENFSAVHCRGQLLGVLCERGWGNRRGRRVDGWSETYVDSSILEHRPADLVVEHGALVRLCPLSVNVFQVPCPLLFVVL